MHISRFFGQHAYLVKYSFPTAVGLTAMVIAPNTTIAIQTLQEIKVDAFVISCSEIETNTILAFSR